MTNASESLSVLALIAKASLVAQLVLLLLLVLLFFAVWFIIRKKKVLDRVRNECDSFEEIFWSGKQMDELEKDVNDGRFGSDGLAAVFLAGQKEFRKLQEKKITDPVVVLESVQRSMEASSQIEVRKLHQNMPFIATVGSVSPYIGLFGTVWGIINAFRALSSSQQVTLAQVAPGIAEALIATALGLLAAIPAVVAFNFFVSRIEQLSERYESFTDHFSNILRRNL